MVYFVAVTNVYKNVFFHGITSSSTLTAISFCCREAGAGVWDEKGTMYGAGSWKECHSQESSNWREAANLGESGGEGGWRI